MPMKGPPPTRQFVDVGRVDVAHPVAVELRTKIVDTKQQDVRPLSLTA